MSVVVLSVLAGAATTFLVIRNNARMIMDEYTKLVATGKVIGATIGTLAADVKGTPPVVSRTATSTKSSSTSTKNPPL
jgi:hypothetical protein